MASTSRFVPFSILLPCSISPRAAAKRSPISRHSALGLELRLRCEGVRANRRLLGGGFEYSPDEEAESPDGYGASFGRAVELFNGGEYYQCHEFLEELWYDAEEPIRTLLHGILQCAVGFHHLFNQNHRGAMMELGEGLCKLRKMDFDDGPFLQFEEEVSAALEFLYQTQKELAACTSEICLAMDGSERSYQLLGSFAAGQHLYRLDSDQQGYSYITFAFVPENSSYEPLKVSLILLNLYDCYVQENPSQPNCNGSCSHNGRACDKPDSHGKRCNRVAASYNSRLQCHKQTWIAEQEDSLNDFDDKTLHILPVRTSSFYSPRLNMAMPSPASESIEIERAIIAGISISHLNNKKQWLLHELRNRDGMAND